MDPSDCNFLGHMNVSRYFASCLEGVFTLQSAFGLTSDDMREERRLSFAMVKAKRGFLMELRAGDSTWLETRVLEIGGKSMTFLHHLIRSPNDEPASNRNLDALCSTCRQDVP